MPVSKKKRAFQARMFGTDFNDCIWGIQEWNLDIRSFSIYLTGESVTYSDDENGQREEPGVEYQMSARLIKNLQILAGIDPGRTILLHMKTDGGDWDEGMAIYDAIKSAPNRIVALNYTHARSMSSIIFQAADKRIMMPHSHFMFHAGTLRLEGTEKQVASGFDFSKNDTQVMLDVYIDRMKERGKYSRWSRKNLREMLKDLMDKREDVFMTAQQTVEWGLADGIFDGDWEGLRKKFPRQKKATEPA